MATFKHSDIKAGYLLRVKDDVTNTEFYMTVIPSAGYTPGILASLLFDAFPIEAGSLACCSGSRDGDNWWPLAHINDDLECKGYNARVTAVYGYATPRELLDNSPENRELLWEREEPAAEPTEGEKNVAPVKMTMEQIQKALGFEVELAEE